MLSRKSSAVVHGILFVALATLSCQYPLLAESLLNQARNGSESVEKRIVHGSRQLILTSKQDGEDCELRLNLPVTPEKISGTYKRGAKGVAFQSSKIGNVSNFTISTLSGRELFRMNQDDKYIQSSILGDRLKSTYDLKFLESARDERRKGLEAEDFRGINVEGDISVAEEYLSTPELAFMPHVSKLIGQELGYTGIAYPSTLPLHVMALSINKRMNPDTQPTSHRPAEPSLNKATCEPYPFQSIGCYGMCGPGCTCWSWVCGDCCFHTGCAVHDDYCRTWLGYAHPYCVDFWIPFYIGGGCS
jgi:hypothetical protein